MEDSAYQALYTGVYVFIFIIAISATIYLFVNMLDYSELAYEYGNKVTEGNIIENISDLRYRLLKGSDVIAYYFNYVKNDKYEKSDSINSQYNVEIWDKNGSRINENDLNYSKIKERIGYDNYYKIEYISESDEKAKIKISLYGE